MRRIVVVLVLVLAACIWPSGQGVAAVQAAPAPGLQADFNNDGAADLAIGVPFEWVGAIQDAGAVNVLYGSAGGLQGPAASSSPRTARGSPVPLTCRTTSALGWRPATSMMMGSLTLPRASRVRMWGAWRTPARSACCPARQVD